MNNEKLPILKHCKYLGVILDEKLNYAAQIASVKCRLSKQCGIVSKLRHFVPKSVWLKYYSSNIKPIIQCGILVYGCVSFSALQAILSQQKKILRRILFLRNRETVTYNFETFGILTVHELYVYELLKFVLRSLNNMHSDNGLNDLFSFETPSRVTRRSQKRFLKVPSSKKNRT